MESGTSSSRVLIESVDYKRFRSWVALRKVSVEGNKIWRYYEWGPKELPPLVLLPGASGTAEVWYQQMLSLCPKGYRIVSAQPPSYSSYTKFLRGFEAFIDSLGASKVVHVGGTALGGYLSLCFAYARPKRVLSVILCNSFGDTAYYVDHSPMAGLFSFAPKFFLTRMLLENFPDGLVEARIADSSDFMVRQLESISQNELASRLSLHCMAGPMSLEAAAKGLIQERITLIDALDDVALPPSIRTDLYEALPRAHQALLRDGGNFPYLSRPEEVNLHMEVHLRRCGNERTMEPRSEEGESEDESEDKAV